MMWAASVFIGLGLLFALVGNIGVLRFPDVYTRLHASSKCSTTSVLSIFIACMLISGFKPITGKILVITFFFFITSPVTAHIIGRHAWKSGIMPWRE